MKPVFFHGKIHGMNSMRGDRKLSEIKKRFKTTIQGKNYVIVGTKPQAHMKAAAELVEEQLEQLKKLSDGLDGERRAILMAINAISKQLELQEKLNDLEEKNRLLEEQLNDKQPAEKKDSEIEEV